MRFHWMMLGASLLAPVAGPALAGQQARAHLLIAGGTATDLRGVRSGAYSLAPSVSLSPRSNFALSLGGRGTRFTSNEWSLGGFAAAGARIPFGAGLGLRLSGNADAVRTSYRGTYLSAEGLPAIEWSSAAFRLWGGARLAAARMVIESSASAGPVPLPGPGSSVTRWLAGPAFGGALRLVRFERGGGVELSYREEHGRPAGSPVVDRIAGFRIARGALELTASLGRRTADAERRTFGGARLAVALLPGVSLLGAAESYPGNRLTGAPGGRAFTAGLSLGVGGPRTPKRLPRPAGVVGPGRGLTRLAIAAPRAARVEVAGDWSQWRPQALQRSANGVWYVDVAIAPGAYRYAFRIDGKSWEVPRGMAAVDDGFGGKTAWLTVPEPERAATQSANPKEAP